MKKITKKIKLVITAGKATPAPPVGTALGPAGINIGEFVKQFNDATKDMDGLVPAEITVYEDRTFDFILKTAPASDMIKTKLKLAKGSGKPLLEKVGKRVKKNASYYTTYLKYIVLKKEEKKKKNLFLFQIW